MKSYRSQLWSSGGGGGSATGGPPGAGGGGGSSGGRFENSDDTNLSQKLFKHNNSEMDCDYSKLFYAKRKWLL